MSKQKRPVADGAIDNVGEADEVGRKLGCGLELGLEEHSLLWTPPPESQTSLTGWPCSDSSACSTTPEFLSSLAITQSIPSQ